MHIDHINISVRDLPSAKAFFLNLGFAITKEGRLEGEWIDKVTGLSGVKAAYVALSFSGHETDLELIQYFSPEGSVDPSISRPNQIGFRHMAFAVDNIEMMVAKLRTKKATFLSDIQKYGEKKKLCYFLGPEGIILELAEYAKE
ncbi:MAG: VOC family protein [Patescibacteria group bacterium]